MKSIDELVKGSGYAKQWKIMLKAQIQPTIKTSVKKSKKWNGCKKLGKRENSQSKTTKAIASILFVGEVVALTKQPKMSQATISATKVIFKKN